jgi:uncharacterized protein YlaI
MHEQSTRKPENEPSSIQLKETINEMARKGTFDHNPLLNTTHFVMCQQCQHQQSIIYLDSLKKGDFEVGKTEQIEVLDSSGPIAFSEMEKVTPIVFTFLCKECGYRMEVRPVSVEYLLVVINKPQALGVMYV